MKDKLLRIFLVLALIFVFASCSSTKEPESNTEVLGDEISTPQTENMDDEVAVDQSENNQSEENNDSAKEETKSLDSSLGGAALLATLNRERPEKLMVESEMNYSGITTRMLAYYDGDRSRTETDVLEMGKSILIFLPEEDIIYSYMDGDTSGVKMVGAEASYGEEMGMTIDDEGLFADIADETSEGVVAKIDVLDGEEVVYIETSDTDEEMGEVLVKMWYSVKYATPLKYEMSAGGENMMTLLVTHIEENPEMDEALFMPSEDINFQEINME